ncbi:hypothetical protein DXG03_008038 [Asterophora parasitica]|uniref:Uncharacterized protein n=1 Tax=Asterophora parasitica TaxID=117018 RepID=A0A9P7KEB2_9AGAR|nr:hypothetical protein DXG03_008038 [Asterophora parasitica]
MSPLPAFTPNPRPTKSARKAADMGATLRRTESYITITDIIPTSSARKTGAKDQQASLVPYHRTLQYYKDQRERRKAQLHRGNEPITIRIRPERPTVNDLAPQPSTASTPTRTPSKQIRVAAPTARSAAPNVKAPPRQNSPLAPTRSTLPGRPLFPRSKPEPDLCRKAIKACMKCSPEGQKILRMGPRLAVSIMSATMELERLVAAQDQDVTMADATVAAAPPTLTKSWVVVSGDDWEMVECGA